jgi:UbiD family decarboxylase
MLGRAARSFKSGRWPQARKTGISLDPRRSNSNKAAPSVESAHLDFRLFVDTLRNDGDLADIMEEVDPYLEVAAITRRAYERRSKAPLFHQVKGAKDGLFRILGASGGLCRDEESKYRRLARHMGLPPNSSLKDIQDRMLSAKTTKPIPPIVVEDGPCKEVKLFGDDIDLTKLPVPLLNKADGGRYIQTLGINIVQHPTEPWTNWSIARAMIHDRNRMSGLIMKPQHIAKIYEQVCFQYLIGFSLPSCCASGSNAMRMFPTPLHLEHRLLQ